MTQLFIALQSQGGGWETIIMIVALFAIMYFMMIRPQQQRAKKENKFRESLKKGDKVMTAGGIFGTVRQIKDFSFVIEVDKNVQIEVNRSSIYPAGEVTPTKNENKKEEQKEEQIKAD